MKMPITNRLSSLFSFQTPCRLTGLVLAAAFALVSVQQAQAQLGPPITNYFEGGFDNNGLDDYPGSAQGWTAGWGLTSGPTTSASVMSSSPLNGGNNYLNVVFSNTTSRNSLYRPYGTFLAQTLDYPRSDSFSVTLMPHIISFDFRVDSFTNSATMTNDWTGESANDTAFILGTQSTGQSKPTASSSWWMQVFAASPSVSNPTGPANKWLIYDGSVVSNSTSCGRFVDSGMAFTFGTVYHFDVVTDPREKTYQVTVSDGVTTNSSAWLHSPNYAAPANFFSDDVFTFGGGVNATTETLTESIDNIIIQQLPPSKFPPRITQLAPFYYPPTPTNLASLLTFTPQLNPPIFFPASKGLSFAVSAAGGGSNDMLLFNGPGDNSQDQSTNALAYKLLVAHTSIPTNGIGLVLNGADVSSGLSISGAANFRHVNYNGLAPNTVYTGTIYVTNSAGATSSRDFSFDTFAEDSAKVIEAEDFNYGNGGYTRPGLAGSDSTVGGLFFENPAPSDFTNSSSTYLNFATGYVDKAGATNIDYYNPAQTNDAFQSLSGAALTLHETATNVYRVAEAVSTLPANDYVRSKYELSGARDFDVANLQSGEWMNYTRTFAPGNYTIYLRASSTRTSSGGNNPVSLNLVTSDPTQPGQTVTNLGVFNVAYTGDKIFFTNTPLTINTNTTNSPIYLSGQQTLQLSMNSAGNNLWLNYLVLVPDASNAPSVAVTSPASGASFSSGANIGLTASASVTGGTISQVEYFNGTTSLGSSASSPYTVNWNSVPTGKYAITAKATTSTGFTASSTPVNITVGSPARKVLFVVDSATESSSLNAGDQLVYDMCTAKGWSNYLHFNANVFAMGPEAANGFDMVIITANSGSGSVATTFRDVPVPVLNYNQAQMGARNGTTKEFSPVDYGINGGQQVVTVVSPGDPASPVGYTGLQNLFNTLDATDYAIPNANAIILTKSTNYPALGVKDFYYQSGAEMCSGIVAPATRMQFFCGNAGNLAANITPFGSNLLSSELDVTMANPTFTGHAPVLGQPIRSGGNVTIPFTGLGSDMPGVYSLYSSSNVTGPYLLDNTAIITGPVGNQFQAVTTVPGNAQYYYRIARLSAE